jgi:endonuclease/exonuclease/phosphatase (EEP) superfamily protein YafD
VRLLVANVLISNDQAAPLLAQVQRLKPDLILLLETDQAWERRLAPLADEYPYLVHQPQDNGYGMHLFSKLELVKPQVRYLLQEGVPSITTRVRLPVGKVIDFYGVHPKPPPHQDTAQRDAELLIVGREVRKETRPAIVLGDLNDVAWSRTTQLFQEISGLLDPRIGRGLYPTFNADWPLDHVFFESSFTLLEMATLGDIGSDHFPFYIALCYQPQAEAVQETPAPEPEDLEDAREAIRSGKEEAREEAREGE